MKKIDPEKIQSDLEKKHSLRQKRKKPVMKVSGRSVKALQRLLIKKSKK
ncbi:hypothetical protein KKF61_04375 [Patescibacteria group bacterium]|nr:hypothetical protein [Patescibacteria group bacterium]MBU0963588.1 hypothetical protein [Patescibacteria group bacterium]